MKYLKSTGLKGQAGFSILEVMIAVAILGVMGVGATTILGNTFKNSGHTTDAMQAIEQVENVGYWINRDVLMTQLIIPGESSGFPLELGWQDAEGHYNQVVYSISGSDLKRRFVETNDAGAVIKSQQRTTASKLNTVENKTYCSYADGVLDFQATSMFGKNSQTRSYQFKVRVDQPTSYLCITTPSLSAGYTNKAYSQGITAAGGTTPYVWTLEAGSLPTGLSFSSAGVISGTPMVGQLFSTYYITVHVTDSANRVTEKSYTIMMNPLTITTASLPDGKKGKNYGSNTPNSPVYLAATGGTTIFTWTITSNSPPYNIIPPGLSLNSSTGLISGTPDSTTGAHTYHFTVTLTDSLSQTVSKSLSIYVAN